MITQIRTEILKLRTTRASMVLLSVAVLLPLARIASIVINAGKVGAPSLGTIASTRDMLMAPGTASLVLLLLGVLCMTAETRYGTITWVALATPDRARIVAAKALAVGGVAAVYAVVMAAVAAALVAAVAGTGLSLVNSEVAMVVLGSLLALPLFAMLGVAVGAIVHNQVAAAVLPLAWFVAVENMLPAYGLGRLAPWLPGGAAAALARVDSPLLLPMWAGGLLLCLYAGGLLALAAILLRRRDLT